MTIRLWISIIALAAVGCVGAPPAPPNNGQPDAGPTPPPPRADAAPVDDSDAAPPEPTTLDVTGTARDYWTDEPLADIEIATDGIDPRVSASSDGAGLFTLVNLPATSAFYVRTSRASGYRVTVNAPVFVVDESVTQDLYVVSEADANRQHTSAGLAVAADTGIIIADMLRADDTPMAGVVAANITLTDMDGAAVGVGPYFLGAVGDIDGALTETTAFGARARVVFLNVPAGFATLTAIDDVDGTVAIDALVRADGAHLLELGGAGDDPPVPAAPKFGIDVYPILQSASKGGSGCGNCHRTGGPAQIFRFDDESAAVYTSVMARAGVVDLDAPALSSLLTAPLYDDPPDHPNATWLDTAAGDYQTILLWIQQGAMQ